VLPACGEDARPSPAPPATPAPSGVPFETLRIHPDVARALTAASRILLEDAPALEVYGLDPAAWRDAGYAGLLDPEALARAAERLGRGDGVTARRTVEDPGVRRRVVAEAYRDFAEPGPSAACFEPRHGVLAQIGDDRVVLLLCFECDAAVVLDASGAGRYAFGTPSSPLKALLDGLLAPR
jgi:hypothetical protein